MFQSKVGHLFGYRENSSLLQLILYSENGDISIDNTFVA
jgi:hypothetical protein